MKRAPKLWERDVPHRLIRMVALARMRWPGQRLYVCGCRLLPESMATDVPCGRCRLTMAPVKEDAS